MWDLGQVLSQADRIQGGAVVCRTSISEADPDLVSHSPQHRGE
jgi:hypothetical protein